MRAAPPADIPLPWDSRPNNTNRESIAGFRLDPLAVSRFDQLLHEIHPEAHHVDVDRIASIGRWLDDLPVKEARAFLAERLTRMELLRSMLADADWDQREGPCVRVIKLLAYLDQEADIIPDSIPLLGLLDDVILLELAWPAVATEADDYLDFIKFRMSDQPDGDGAQKREAWINDRLNALALLQQQNRINDSRYAESGEPKDTFRVR